MLRVACLPLYPIQGASSRYRLYQFLGELAKNDIQPTLVVPPQGNPVERLAYFSRLVQAFLTNDVIFIQKRLFPNVLLRLLHRINPNIVYDFDDAIYLKSSGEADKLKARKLDLMLKLSKHVIVGNDYLAQYVRQHNQKVTVIPTVVDMRQYSYLSPVPKDVVTIGWVGYAHNMSYLDELSSVFSALYETFGDQIALHIISNQPFTLSETSHRGRDLKIAFQSWSLEREIDNLRAIDIGIMPLTDDEWSRGKCGFKLIQYMALGIPAIASPVGVNAQIVQDGVNGFLAASQEEWLKKLTLLIQNDELRQKMGQAARHTIESSYSLTSALPTLLTVLQSAQQPSESDQA